MKTKIILIFSLLSVNFFIISGVYAQPKKEFTYQTVPNDPLKARIYKLDNGLTVYMTIYKNAPRIQTYVAVRAGSKNDPSDATGLAHYLEHMLFKGTDKFGSLDYSKEKPELDKIENLYETYRGTKDTLMRKSIYHQIDSISGVAAKYAIANEYDKMLSSIGAKGTNAYTSVEQTVYVNDIPANQLQKWITIEAERYRNPVLRLFHTELEAVYEEKNRNLDSDDSKAWEALYAGLYQKHSYGTQTTIGTIDHLKNPSLKKIKNYYSANYIPNNMAICLSGDLDFDQTIQWINEKFGALKSKPVPVFNSPVEDPITKPVVKDVYGPDAESMMLAFRFPGTGSREADLMTMADMVICNGNAGLIDLNLNQKQKVLSSGTYLEVLKDYSDHIFYGQAREGQKLEEVRDLLLSQIELVKKGEFPDWLLPATITDLKLRETKTFERNGGRANAFVESFIVGSDWKYSVEKINRLSKITKQEVIDFVKKNYSNNYVIVLKHTGEDKTTQKVIKPAITPVEVNRESKSPFLQSILDTKAAEINPVFIDYQRDIKQLKMSNGIPINYYMNSENNLFNLYYIVEMGNNNDKKIGVSVDYLPYLGTSKFSPEALQQEFYKIGCSFGVFNSDEQIYVSLSGLTENMEKALQLFESLLKDPQPNPTALTNLENDILKKRTDAKLNKGNILWDAMYNYAEYGPKSPFTNILSETELKSLKPDELITRIKGITSFEHHILFYGPVEPEKLVVMLDKNHLTPAKLNPVPAAVVFPEKETNDSLVYVCNYDMKQAEIIMLSKGEKYNKNIAPVQRMYNEYFGGNMGSIVFQDMRESKALAYSVFSGYRNPGRKDQSHYNMAYVGTQADKLSEAMAGMSALLTDMPSSEVAYASAKNAVTQQIATERITRSEILFNYERAKKMGLDHDIRKDVYEKIPSIGINEITAFQKNFVKGKPYTILVLGDDKMLDMNTLKKYGKVKTLSLTEVFGY